MAEDWVDMALAYERVRTFARLAAGSHGGADASAGELELLVLMHRAGSGITTGELARQSGMRKMNVSRLAAALLDRGWAERRPHPTDGRSYELSLTPAGRSVLQEGVEARLGPLYAARRAVGTDDFDRLLALIERASAAMTASERGGEAHA